MADLIPPRYLPYVAMGAALLIWLFYGEIRRSISSLTGNKNPGVQSLPAKRDLFIDHPTYGRCRFIERSFVQGQDRADAVRGGRERKMEVKMQDAFDQVWVVPMWEHSLKLIGADDIDTQYFRAEEGAPGDIERVNSQNEKLRHTLAVRDAEVGQLLTDRESYNERLSKMMDKMQLKNKFFFPTGKAGQMPKFEGGGGEE